MGSIRRDFFICTAGKTSKSGICKLCENKVEHLQASHILPKFVFRWLKNTSATGYIRTGQNPNRRAQDGLKEYWLCESCEGLFNDYETVFANTVFHPYLENAAMRIAYGEWLIKFCVSISWRALLAHKEWPDTLLSYNEAQMQHVEKALTRWKSYLLGQVVHPGQYEQHLIPLDAIESHTIPDLPSNINRYILRVIDMDVATDGQNIFVYSKLGRFLILGFVNMQYPRHWEGSKVHLKRGHIEPRKYVLPDTFGEYFHMRARQTSEIEQSISSPQVEKMMADYTKDLDKTVKSETFRALQHDVAMFGRDVFKRDEN